MPCSTSSTLRVVARRALGEEPLLQVGELGAERRERRLAVGLLAVEARRGVGLDRGQVDGPAGTRSAETSMRAHHRSWALSRAPDARRACSRPRCRRVPSVLRLVEPEALGEADLVQHPQRRPLRWSGAAKYVVASGKPVSGPLHPGPEHPGADAAADPGDVADRVVDADRVRVGRRARRTRGSRRSGSPARSPTDRPLASTTHIRVGVVPSMSGPYFAVTASSVGSPSPAHHFWTCVGRAPAGDVGQVAAGHRPQGHPGVVVDDELLHLARQVERHRLRVHARDGPARRRRPGLALVHDPGQGVAPSRTTRWTWSVTAQDSRPRPRSTTGGSTDHGKSIQRSVLRQT